MPDRIFESELAASNTFMDTYVLHYNFILRVFFNIFRCKIAGV